MPAGSHRRKRSQPTARELGRALRSARGDATQAAIAQAIGVDQPSVSRWERGEASPSLDQIAAYEEAAGRPRGYVLVAAGYVDDVPSVERALAADRDLDDEQRAFVLRAYHAARVRLPRR